jgi:glucokinase
MSKVVGIDLGGTGLRAGVVAEDGTITRLRQFAHGGFPRPVDAIDRIAKAIEAVSDGEKVDAVGVGVAAWVERGTGFIARAPNLGWLNVPFGELLERRLGVPVVVHNDLKAIAWGEYRFGSGRGANTLFVVFVGTGVGSAIVTEGTLWTGARGFGGELGHVRVGPDDGPPCGCGRRGCLESYVGGSALARRAEALRAQGALRSIGSAEAVPEITAAHLEAAARRGDAEARALLEQGGDLLGRALGAVVNLLNPDVLLFGGGVWNASESVQDAVRVGIELTSHPDLRKSVRIVESALGDAAGVSGSADLARRRLTSP